MDRDKRNLLRAALRTAGCDDAKIAEIIALAENKGLTKGVLQPLAVNQARAAELYGCSRFHIRKLEKMGLLRTVSLGGLKRYPLAEVMKLIGG